MLTVIITLSVSFWCQGAAPRVFTFGNTIGGDFIVASIASIPMEERIRSAEEVVAKANELGNKMEYIISGEAWRIHYSHGTVVSAQGLCMAAFQMADRIDKRDPIIYEARLCNSNRTLLTIYGFAYRAWLDALVVVENGSEVPTDKRRHPRDIYHMLQINDFIKQANLTKETDTNYLASVVTAAGKTNWISWNADRGWKLLTNAPAVLK